MNSEELEVSLRAEFENYLKDIFAGMRQEISQLQSKIEAELENYKSQLDESFKEVLNRAESGADFDAVFKESVVEHLRLARDEGSRISAVAFAAAEDFRNAENSKEQSLTKNGINKLNSKRRKGSSARKKQLPTGPGIKELNAAISDISGKDSQGEILKSLVHHASQFASRGAFFVVKKDHFVAWRTFDGKNNDSKEAVNDILLPVSADSILSESVRSLATVESNSETYGDDAGVLEKLDFGAPDKMYAIPLIARGRGVAVLYADYGSDGGEVNVEALEMMVHVAGLTVEILASSQGNAPKRKVAERNVEQEATAVSVSETAETESAPVYQSPTTEEAESEYAESSENANQSFSEAENNSDSVTSSHDYSTQDYSAQDFSSEPNNEAEEAEHHSDNYASEIDETDYSDQHKTEELPSYEDVENSSQTGENYPTYEDNAWNQPAETDSSTDVSTEHDETDSKSEEYPAAEPSWNESTEHSTPMISAQEYADNFVKEADAPTTDFVMTPTNELESSPYQDFSANQTNEYHFEKPTVTEFETSSSETYAPVTSSANNFESEVAKPAESFVSAPAVAAETPVASTPVKSRLSERNVDLPIEVSEDERRLHNDARRFARLLVSEIKLYNEQKVKEGREVGDLYEKLREAIDRSREMYDKRVQSPVAAKFDYFHYELVNTLAEGNANKLGASYPGATV